MTSTLYQVLILSFCIFSTPLYSQKKQVSSRLEIFNIETNKRTIVLEEDTHFEAPNWSHDGEYLLINQNGSLFKVYFNGHKEKLYTAFADRCNNDHGISPDGKTLALSHNLKSGQDGWLSSCIFIVPIEGGVPTRITKNTPSFWHGWSPDSSTLVYTAKRDGKFNIYAIAVSGGDELALTDSDGLDDGPEYAPDGAYIYYNSMQSGKMEIWRMRNDGSNKEQLTNDKYSNWFAHPSPDNKYFVFISYLENQGSAHPAMKKVALRLYNIQNKSIKTLFKLTGGQGTLNVPSWSPDGKSFAFVSYEYL